MMGDNCNGTEGGSGGGAIDQNSFADLFPTNWGDFDLDSLSMDKFLGGADLSNALESSAALQKTASAHGNTASSPSDSSISLSPMAKEPVGMRNGNAGAGHDPVTKMRNGPGRIPRQRPKPQNLFSVWAQPQMAHPMMAMGYGPTSPYLGEYNMMAGGSPPMMAADPYAWMQAGRIKRPAMSMSMNMYGQPTSPSLLYNPYGAPMASPPFGFQSHFPMTYQPPMKLPVHALHRPAEPAPTNNAASSFMAPIVLPVDLGKSMMSPSGKSDGPVDPSAIPSAITSFLGNGESSGLDENMRLYELTFRSFVKEEAKIDYANVTVVELKRLLRKYQLAATGKKEELIKMVKDVSEFLKKLPIFKEAAEEQDMDKNEEEKESAEASNQAEANGQDQSIDRFLA